MHGLLSMESYAWPQVMYQKTTKKVLLIQKYFFQSGVNNF